MKHIKYAGRLPELSANPAINSGARPWKICADCQFNKPSYSGNMVLPCRKL